MEDSYFFPMRTTFGSGVTFIGGMRVGELVARLYRGLDTVQAPPLFGVMYVVIMPILRCPVIKKYAD